MDPVSARGPWEVLDIAGPLPLGRLDHCVTLDEKHLYMIGGYSYERKGADDDMWLLNLTNPAMATHPVVPSHARSKTRELWAQKDVKVVTCNFLKINPNLLFMHGNEFQLRRTKKIGDFSNLFPAVGACCKPFPGAMLCFSIRTHIIILFFRVQKWLELISMVILAAKCFKKTFTSSLCILRTFALILLKLWWQWDFKSF